MLDVARLEQQLDDATRGELARRGLDLGPIRGLAEHEAVAAEGDDETLAEATRAAARSAGFGSLLWLLENHRKSLPMASGRTDILQSLRFLPTTWRRIPDVGWHSAKQVGGFLWKTISMYLCPNRS